MTYFVQKSDWNNIHLRVTIHNGIHPVALTISVFRDRDMFKGGYSPAEINFPTFGSCPPETVTEFIEALELAKTFAIEMNSVKVA
jgi:hypothetical protein